MGADTPVEVEGAVRLGALIRTERNGRFTLQQLAEQAEVSVGSLSQIERGLGNPSFSTLLKIASALDLRIGDLVEGGNETTSSGPLVVRRHERARLQIGSEGLIYELITPNLRGKLEMLQTSVPIGFTNRENPFLHEGEECVLVVEGRLRVGVGDVTHQLGEGDAITFDPSVPHWWVNESSSEATLVGAVTPPSF